MHELKSHEIHYVYGGFIDQQNQNTMMLSCGIGAMSPNPLAAFVTAVVCLTSFIAAKLGL
jgi:hypothetical protein